MKCAQPIIPFEAVIKLIFWEYLCPFIKPWAVSGTLGTEGDSELVVWHEFEFNYTNRGVAISFTVSSYLHGVCMKFLDMDLDYYSLKA